MRIFFTLAISCIVALSFWACTNLENATPSDRNTFIRIYEGPLSFTASDLLVENNGYLILGNMQVEDDSVVTIIIKTDKYGAQIGEVNYYPGGSGKSIKPFTNTTFTGYLVLGDRIQVDPNAEEVGNIEIASARLLGIRENLLPEGSAMIGDTNQITPQRPVLTDYKGNALTITDDGSGRVVLISTYKPEGETERPLLVVLNQNFTFDTNPYKQINTLDVDWYDAFLSIDKDYLPGKSVHYFSNTILVAGSKLKEQGSFNDSYIAVTKIPEQLPPDNGSTLEYPLPKLFKINDIQPATSTAFGFGVVGTFGETDGTKQNMFFTTVNTLGTINVSDTLFIDSFLSKTGSTTSSIEDTGETISNTSDGGFILAGTMLTTPIGGRVIGNGARDIFLVKINVVGEIAWTKILGGAGDEVVSTVRETPDGGLLICGTNNLGGYSSIFLIKTDKNGELKN